MNSQSQKLSFDVSVSLSDKEYNRQRLTPEPGDQYYTHLSDVRLFLAQSADDSFCQVLDYGCGGSPYRPLFKTKKYVRADYVDCGGVDVLINESGKLDLPDACCDLVLSTQVLEHVFSPQIYLTEALRVLRPGGRLILTTHGVWEDHGCPYDFWRWTADGLRRELSNAGLQVKKVQKLTTGARAILFHFGQIYDQGLASRRGMLGWAFWLLKQSSFGNAARRHQWMDRRFSENRIVDSETPDHSFYLALGIEAVKNEK